MKRKLKYAVILAGLMGSSVSMAATGDAVQGASGTINVSGRISLTTCSATLDSASQSFTLNRADISGAAAGASLARPFTTLTLNSCSGYPLTAKVTASKPGTDSMTGLLDGDSAGVLGYNVGFSAATGVTGGVGDNHEVPVDGSAAATPLSIIPDANSYALKMTTYVKRVGSAAVPGDLGALTGSYTYTINYL